MTLHLQLLDKAHSTSTICCMDSTSSNVAPFVTGSDDNMFILLMGLSTDRVGANSSL